jgi:hypothetical protein
MKVTSSWLLFLTAALQASGWGAAGAVESSPTSSADDDTAGDDTMAFTHFIAHNKTMTCSADEHARPFNNQVRGVSLGGWMVGCRERRNLDFC